MRVLIGLLTCLAALAVAAAVPAADDMPRYRFQPGQRLTFHVTSEFKSGEGDSTSNRSQQSDWTVWVVRTNADGSFRLVLREKRTLKTTHGKQTYDLPEWTLLVYGDVFPDGRVTPNSTIRAYGHPNALFPRLPADAAGAKTGWKAVREDDSVLTFRPTAPGAARFTSTSESLFNKIYLLTNTTHYTFDPAKGFVTRNEWEDTQGYHGNGKGSGAIELAEIKKMDSEQLRAFAAAADKYFAVVAAYDDATEAAEKAKPEEAKAMLAKALDGLKAAEKEITQPDLHVDLAERIKQHDQTAKHALDSAERRAAVIGKPAAAFETTDMGGKKVNLSDLKGKVVVLDFWYRGCGWCIRSMPQLNEVAADFAGQPVALLGMNIDQKEEDAKFVMEKMSLKYPTLKAKGLPQKFGVSGYPTLIIIDRQGTVADIHYGYSPTLRADIGKAIRDLLAKQ